MEISFMKTFGRAAVASAYNSMEVLLNLPGRAAPRAWRRLCAKLCRDKFISKNNILISLAGSNQRSHINVAQAMKGCAVNGSALSGRATRMSLQEGGYAMRTFDLAPLYRSTVGFDRLFSLLDQGIEGAAPGYPPYNIERTGENAYRVSVAVAGFNEPELSIVAKENTLTIRGEKNAKEEEKRGEVLYQGIAARTFERVFQLADYVQVKGASLENGLLHVDLVREIPEAKKPRTIPINGKSNGPTVIENQKVA
jgi:molecular chaperone IbpA